MRIIACREHEDASCIDTASAQLRADYPCFARDIPAALERYEMIEPIKTTLLKDLAAAGYASTTWERQNSPGDPPRLEGSEANSSSLSPRSGRVQVLN